MLSGPRLLRDALLALTLLSAASAAGALTREECEKQFAPRSGQPGKDVIWVPTREELVMAMLKAANVSADDCVVDLGSGDGRIPIAAAKHFGAKALGIEYNPKMVQLAQCNIRAEGLEGKVEVREGDIFETDFSDADVVTLYLLSGLNLKLRPTLLEMKPGTRIVSNSFDMGEWQPDQEIEPSESFTRGYLWIVPAQVEGHWRFKEQGGKDEFELQIDQEYQQIEVQPQMSQASTAAVKEADLRGSDVSFTVVGAGPQPLAFTGEAKDDSMELTTRKDGRTVTYVGERTDAASPTRTATAPSD